MDKALCSIDNTNATYDILVTRADGSHFISGPYCEHHAKWYYGEGSRRLIGTNEMVLYEMLPIR